MNSSWKVHDFTLEIYNQIVKFEYPIEKVKQCGKYVIVLLQFKREYNPDDFTNNLFAITEAGRIAWKMEKPDEIGIRIDPIVDFILRGDQIMVVDYCSKKLFVNLDTGKIQGEESGRW